MQDYNQFFHSVMALLTDDEDAALALIRSYGMCPRAVVHLPEGDLSPLDALCYARVLTELGQVVMGEAIVHEVVAAELKPVDVAA